MADGLVLPVGVARHGLCEIQLEQVADIMQQRGDDDVRRLPVALGKERGLQAVLLLRHRLAAIKVGALVRQQIAQLGADDFGIAHDWITLD